MDLFEDGQEEEKNFEVPKPLTRADTNFSLKMYHELGEDETNITITVDELEKLNENREISASILDFIMKSKHQEFKEKDVIVLTTPVIARLKADFEGKQGEILKDAIGGSAFDYKAIALPNIKEESWELFVVEYPSELFKDTFSKLKEGISSIVSSIGSFFTGSSNQKKVPRLMHIVGGESGHTSKEVIYSTMNAHFKTLFPDSSIADYLHLGTSEINEEQLIYQRVQVELTSGSNQRGGEFIYAFMSRCYIDGRPFPADKAEINQEQFFAHNNFSLSEFINILKELPGTEVKEGWDGSAKIVKSATLNLDQREPTTSLEIFIDNELTYEQHRENKKEEEEEEERLRNTSLQIYVDNQMTYERHTGNQEQEERLRNTSLQIYVDNQLQYERHSNQYQDGDDDEPQVRRHGSSLQIFVQNELVCQKHRDQHFIQDGKERNDSTDSDTDHDSVKEMKLHIDVQEDSDESEVEDTGAKFKTQALPNAKSKKKGKKRKDESKEEYPDSQNSYYEHDLVGEPSKHSVHDYNSYGDASPFEFTVSRGLHKDNDAINPPAKEKKKTRLEIQDASHRESGCCSSCSIF